MVSATSGRWFRAFGRSARWWARLGRPTSPECLRHRGTVADDPGRRLGGGSGRGTAGALANLAHHLDGRSVLAVNADSVFDADLADVVAAWDGERPLVAHGGRDGFRPGVPVVASITPWSAIEALPQSPSGLFGHLWRDAHAEGRLQSVQLDSPVLDCGTPASYLAANLALFGGATSVEVGQVDATGAGDIARDNPGDTVEPHEGVTRSVLWSGARVGPGSAWTEPCVRRTDARSWYGRCRQRPGERVGGAT